MHPEYNGQQPQKIGEFYSVLQNPMSFLTPAPDTDRQIDIHRHTGTHGHIHTHTQVHVDTQKQTHTHTDTQTYRHTLRHTEARRHTDTKYIRTDTKTHT